MLSTHQYTITQRPIFAHLHGCMTKGLDKAETPPTTHPPHHAFANAVMCFLSNPHSDRISSHTQSHTFPNYGVWVVSAIIIHPSICRILRWPYFYNSADHLIKNHLDLWILCHNHRFGNQSNVYPHKG
jgi:hypothetical protein